LKPESYIADRALLHSRAPEAAMHPARNFAQLAMRFCTIVHPLVFYDLIIFRRLF